MSTVDKNTADTEQLQKTNDDQVIHKVPPSDELINTQTLQQGVTEQPTPVSIEPIHINTQRIFAVRNQSSQPSSQTIIGYENYECVYMTWWIITVVTGFCWFAGIPCLILLHIANKRKRAGDFEGAGKAWLWCIRVNRAFITVFSISLVIGGIIQVAGKVQKR